MICPHCQHIETKVTDKRESKGATRRRRECLKCSKRFTTYERFEEIDKFVIKKDGRREPFNRDKVFLGVIKACEKRNISHDQIDEVIKALESEVIKNEKEISTKKIGEFVMNKLKTIDKVAYIRFASVYRDFEDINDFKQELKEL
ncbi:MAG: transcriptional regulator NrdR [Candidatus Pacearchaeota archaeon]|jgi:transcriptional repressor NrdR